MKPIESTTTSILYRNPPVREFPIPRLKDIPPENRAALITAIFTFPSMVKELRAKSDRLQAERDLRK
jgi:hypothetical protein